MSDTTLTDRPAVDADRWLRSYYALRAVVSALWVTCAVTVGPASMAVAAVLLLLYPAWDALANAVDAHRNGGWRINATQSFNAAASSATTVGVALALMHGMSTVVGVFGVWAMLSGLLQLATAVRRWKRAGGQWVMVVSGAQSAAAGAIMLREAGAPDMPGVADIAPYAAFGAFYFLLSAIWLTVVLHRRRRPAAR
jgi:uncharacterized membrane protein HdeD (DUF308 family)